MRLVISITFLLLVGAGCAPGFNGSAVAQKSQGSVWQALNSHLGRLPMSQDGELYVRQRESDLVVTTSLSRSWSLTVRLNPPYNATSLGELNGNQPSAGQREALQIVWNLVHERSFDISKPFHIKQSVDEYFYNFSLSLESAHEGGDMTVRVRRDSMKPEVLHQF